MRTEDAAAVLKAAVRSPKAVGEPHRVATTLATWDRCKFLHTSRPGQDKKDKFVALMAEMYDGAKSPRRLMKGVMLVLQTCKGASKARTRSRRAPYLDKIK